MKLLFPVTTFLRHIYMYKRTLVNVYRQIPVHLNVYPHSFFPSTAKIWNSFLAITIEASNTDDSKKGLWTTLTMNPI